MKFNRNYRSLIFLAAFLLVFAISGSVAAQDDKAKPEATKVSEGEAKLAKKLQEGNDAAAKMKLAQEFVKKYPNSPIRAQVADYVAGQIGAVSDSNQKLALAESYSKTFTNAGEADYIAPTQIETYAKLKRYDDAFKIAGDYLSRKPEDLGVRLQLSVEGSNLARGGEDKYAAQSRDFAVKAIEIIESGKKPAGLTDAQWKDFQTKWLAQLYQSLGFLDSAAGNSADALANFEKAAKVDQTDVNSWAMIGFIINQNYQRLANKYTLAPRNEQDELRKQAEAEMDKVIEAYARVVAMTEGKPEQQSLNTQIRGDLEAYYKFRHNNSTEGLQALIDKYKAPK